MAIDGGLAAAARVIASCKVWAAPDPSRSDSRRVHEDRPCNRPMCCFNATDGRSSVGASNTTAAAPNPAANHPVASIATTPTGTATSSSRPCRASQDRRPSVDAGWLTGICTPAANAIPNASPARISMPPTAISNVMTPTPDRH